MKTSVFQAARVAAVLLLALCSGALTGCGHMPWSAKPAAAPESVNVLVQTLADGTPTQPFLQYWKRNTLVLDMREAASNGGNVTLRPRDGAKWPARLAFRVMPGQIGLIEVQADQRLLIPVTREGAKAVDLELVPGVYTAKTTQIIVKWEAARAPAP